MIHQNRNKKKKASNNEFSLSKLLSRILFVCFSVALNSGNFVLGLQDNVMHFQKFDTLLGITYEIVSLGPGYRVQNQTRKAITIAAEPQQDFQPSYLLTIPDAWKVGQLGFWVFVSFVSVQCFLQKNSLLFFLFPFFSPKQTRLQFCYVKSGT